VRNLGGDSRLARPGRAADHDDDRHVQALQVRQPPQAPHGALALFVGEHLACEHVQTFDLERPLAALGEVELDPARQLVRRVRRDADRDQSARHHPLRIGEVRVAERKRLAVTSLGHVLRTGASASSCSS
jgi:hypothetical protein